MSNTHPSIHPTALVSAQARLADNVSVGPFTVIHDNVEIGAGSVIGAHCELGVPTSHAAGLPLVMGPGALVRSHSVFYEGSTFGARLVTGHRVTVREKTQAGINLQIGTLSDIQGSCAIGNYVRLHSNVFTSQGCKIGNFVWLFPAVVITDDPTPPSNKMFPVSIADYVAVGAGAILLPGISIDNDALVAAGSVVRNDVEKEQLVAGNPAKVIYDTRKITLRGTGNVAYPWRRHFHRGYPPEIVRQWLTEFPMSRIEEVQ